MDHTAGLASLKAEFGAPAYGSRAEAKTTAGLTHLLDDGDRFHLEGIDLEFETLLTPGHTLGQIAYVNRRHLLLFSGDTLFSAGCGRLFEGTAAQMHASLSRLASLPEDTAVYCGHEYTLANLAFAAAVEPDNADVRATAQRVRALRERGEPSLPSSLGLERRVNPFLRCEAPSVRQAAEQRAGHSLSQPPEVFAVLRGWKDTFRAQNAP
jgi:hydroxyacylglutathione hydrolase